MMKRSKKFDEMTAEEKIRRARTMLVLGSGDEPFYGSIALGMELIEVNSIFLPTAGTTGKELLFNPNWFNALDNIEQVMGVVEHEVLHGAMKHCVRQADARKTEGKAFDEDAWQQSTDFAINPILVRKKRQLPGQPLYDPKYDGMAAERIYALLKEEKKQLAKQQCQKPGPSDGGQSPSPGDGKPTPSEGGAKAPPGNKQAPQPGSSSGHGASTEQPDPDAGAAPAGQKEEPAPAEKTMQEKVIHALTKLGPVTDPGGCGCVLPPMDFDTGEPLTGQAKEEFEREFEARVVQAARVVEKEQGNVPGFLKDIIMAHTEPQITYKDHLWNLMDRVARDDYSMSRPNKRFDMYIPSIYNKVPGELLVVIDTSGSVSVKEQKIYASEISGILEEFMDGLDMLVIYHDTRVTGTQELTPEDLPVKLQIRGGGGTSYKPVFNYIKKEGLDPKAVIWFTDLWVGNNEYRGIEVPDWEHLWLNTSPRRHSNPPFGTIIDLDPNA